MRLPEIVEAAEQLLRMSDVFNIWPTPLEKVLLAAGLVGVYDLADPALGLPPKFSRAVRRSRRVQTDRAGLHGFTYGDKVGIDTKRLTPVAQRFTVAHEIGHFAGIPWHSETYRSRLSFDVHAHSGLEREAEMFADEILFQGDTFHEQLSSAAPSVSLPLNAAAGWGVSASRALRRYVETSTFPIAAFVAPVSIQTQLDGALSAGRSFQSRAFARSVGPLRNWLPRTMSFRYDPQEIEHHSWLEPVVRDSATSVSTGFEKRVHAGYCDFRRVLPGQRFFYTSVSARRPATDALVGQDFVVVMLELDE